MRVYSLVATLPSNGSTRVGSSAVASVARAKVEGLDGTQTEGTVAFAAIDRSANSLATNTSVTAEGLARTNEHERIDVRVTTVPGGRSGGGSDKGCERSESNSAESNHCVRCVVNERV